VLTAVGPISEIVIQRDGSSRLVGLRQLGYQGDRRRTPVE
jgi:hypothetical protein